MEKMFFYDTETTGLDPKTCAIHQLSAIIRINDTVVKKLDFKIRPFEGAVIDPVALNISNVTEEEIMRYPPHQECYKQLSELLGTYVSKYDKSDKFHLLGFNIMGFDNEFFRALWLRNNDEYFGSFFWGNSIDIMSEASSFLRRIRPNMENFKLYYVAKTLRIDIDDSKLHDALYDVELSAEIYDKIERVRTQVK